MSSSAVPRWLWLGLPVGMVVLQLVLKALDEQLYRTWMRGELGLVENLTVLALVLAAITGVWLFRERSRVRSRWFGRFAIVMTVGCAFFAGEEASWGQHWFGYEPPDAIAERNDQGEFNLHNDPLLENVLDQLPRNLLTLAALVGGVIAPLVRRRRPRLPDFDTSQPWGWIWPDPICLPSALLAVTITLPGKLFEAARGEIPPAIDISAGETKELCLALFLMIYLTCLRRALKAQA